jgi:hypothetical protein
MISSQRGYRLSQERALLKWRAWNRSQGHCWWCGRELEFEVPLKRNVTPDVLVLGRIDPKRGLDFDNVVVSCFSCNAGEGKRTVEEFRHCIINRLRRESCSPGMTFSRNQLV